MLTTIPEDVTENLEHDDFLVNLVNSRVANQKPEIFDTPGAKGTYGLDYKIMTDGSVGIRSAGTKGSFYCPPDIYRVIALIEQLINSSIETLRPGFASEDSNGNMRIPVVRWGTEQEGQLPCVVVKINRGTPGAFGKGPESAPSTKQRAPVIQEVVRNPSDHNSEIFIFRHRRDYWISLECVALKAQDADYLTNWIDWVIDQNLWYFRNSGVAQFLFSEQLADTTREVEGKSAHCRCLKYHVATQSLSWQSFKTLRRINLTLNLSN